MAQCPTCSEKVSLFYQIVPWNDPHLMLRNLSKLRHDAVIACQSCRGKSKVKNPFDLGITLKLVAALIVAVMAFKRVYSYVGVHNRNEFLLFILVPFCAVMYLVVRFLWYNFTHLESTHES
jgi:hypothetical protein